jgi:hypothetical protein
MELTIASSEFGFTKFTQMGEDEYYSVRVYSMRTDVREREQALDLTFMPHQGWSSGACQLSFSISPRQQLIRSQLNSAIRKVLGMLRIKNVGHRRS